MRLAAVLFAGFLTLGMVGCGKQTEEEKFKERTQQSSEQDKFNERVKEHGGER